MQTRKSGFMKIQMKVHSLLGSGLEAPHIIELLVSFMFRIWSKKNIAERFENLAILSPAM